MEKVHQMVLDKTALWLSNMENYFETFPNAFNVFFYFLQNDQERLDLAVSGIKKTNEGFGFSIENPLTKISIAGCYGMFELLELAVVKRKSYYNCLEQGYIIDEFDLQTESGELLKMYNKVEALNFPKY